MEKCVDLCGTEDPVQKCPRAHADLISLVSLLAE